MPHKQQLTRRMKNTFSRTTTSYTRPNELHINRDRRLEAQDTVGIDQYLLTRLQCLDKKKDECIRLE